MAGPRVYPAVMAASARERIVDTAYQLFSRHGIRAVGVDTIAAEAGIAKMTLYRHFPSKDDLVLEFLSRREERWTNGWLRAEVELRDSGGAERLLAIFVLLEFDDPDHPARRASVLHLANIREFLAALAGDAGVADPDAFARQWHVLMKGSIVAAGEGDRGAARRAQDIGRLLLAREGAAAIA